ncbi:MAG: MarR family transcriptional regulator [Burkholderiaceae bacterium]|nr:MarR family transcriptional regulator [Microbacteriaceae bacterium]
MTVTDETDHASAVLEVEQQLGTVVRQLYATARRSAAQVDPTLPPFGLKLLRLLERSGPTHASAAAELLNVDRSFVSRQVKQLEELGLIEVRVDSRDGRARLIAVTPLAIERMSLADDTSDSPTHRALGTWGGEDLRQLAALLARLTDTGL